MCSSDLAWRVPFFATEPTVLAWGATTVLWAPQGSEQGRLLAIDMATGRVRWHVDEATALFNAPLTVSPGGDVVDRTEQRHVEALAVGPMVVVWRGDGHLAALRIDGSGEVAWRQAPDGIHQLQAVASNGDEFDCVGLPETGSDAPRVEVRQASDGAGRLRGACPPAIGRPQWVQGVPQGIVLGGSEGVALLRSEEHTSTPVTL